MTIRMQLRMNSYESWGNAGVYFRATRANCYKAGVVENQLFLVRERDGAGTVLRQPTVPGFNPTQQDIIVEINATDFTDNSGQRTSRLEVYHWFPGQEKPAEPLISLVDGMFAQGGLALYVDGQLRSSAEAPLLIWSGATDFALGGNPNYTGAPEFLAARFADLRFCARALSPAEVKQLHETGCGKR